MNKRKRLISIIAGVLAAIMLLGILASLLPVSAASSDEIQDQIEELQKQSAPSIPRWRHWTFRCSRIFPRCRT